MEKPMTFEMQASFFKKYMKNRMFEWKEVQYSEI